MRSTCGRSPTATATASATSRACERGSPYLRDLGVDAIWFTPWYPSPMADGGYDIADYRDIDPMFGTLAEAELLIEEAAELGLRVIVDIVPNHCSDRAPVVPRRAGRRAGLARARPVLVPPGPRRTTASCRRTTGRPSSAAARGRGPGTPTGARASGTSTCSRRSSPTSTGTTTTFGGSTRRCCASGSTAASPASASTPPRSSSRTARSRTSTPRDAPSPHPFTDRDELHEVYRVLARGGRRVRGRADHDRRDLAPGRRALRPLPAPGRDAHGVQLRVPRLPVAARAAACVHRRDACRARTGRRAGDVGALEPRRDPARHALRPRGHDLRVRGEDRRDPVRRPGARARGGRAPPRC